MQPNPAYVQWVTMVKGDEEKLVHPGNVDNHINAGWQVKEGQIIEAQTDQSAFQSLTLPEITEEIVKHEQQHPAADEESASQDPGTETKSSKRSRKK